MKKGLTRIGLHNLSDLQELANSVGWYFEPQRANMYIACGSTIGYRIGDRLVSSAALFCYESLFSSLGIVIVHPNYQGQGLGKNLVRQCLAHAEQMNVPISLVSTKEGFPLYTSMGFRTFGFIHRLTLTNLTCQKSHINYNGLNELCKDDLSDIIAFDRIAFGANRRHIYHLLLAHVYRGLTVRDADNRLRGFIMAFQLGETLHIGPLLADDTEIAIQLIRSLLFLPAPQTIRIDVPDNQSDFINELEKYGFRETLISPFMLKNTDALPGKRSHLFAIIDPALG